MNDDEVLLEWLRSRGVVFDQDTDAIRRPTRKDASPEGNAVEAHHLALYLSGYMEENNAWYTLTLRDPENFHAKHILRNAVRLWMLGLYW